MFDELHPAQFPGTVEVTAFLDGAQEAVLVHNAGVVEPLRAIGTLDAGMVMSAVQVNLLAPMRDRRGWVVHSVNPGCMDTGMREVMRRTPGEVWFPARGRYSRLAADGDLPAPDDVARRIIAYRLP
ncbi:hypothetical protein ACIBEJ_22380 [Nonomuraea sp. NPDC050790]|uniref:hypothetical protein n=1 Tax=Nonomuraea sp. NPDC050790 TaxID=3364371 RepID=UPI0037A6044C